MRIRRTRTGIFNTREILFESFLYNSQLLGIEKSSRRCRWFSVELEDLIFSKTEGRSELLVTSSIESDPVFVTVTVSHSILSNKQPLPNSLLSADCILQNIMALPFKEDTSYFEARILLTSTKILSSSKVKCSISLPQMTLWVLDEPFSLLAAGRVKVGELCHLNLVRAVISYF